MFVYHGVAGSKMAASMKLNPLHTPIPKAKSRYLFVASKPLDVYVTPVGRGSAGDGFIQSHVTARVRSLNFRLPKRFAYGRQGLERFSSGVCGRRRPQPNRSESHPGSQPSSEDLPDVQSWESDFGGSE